MFVVHKIVISVSSRHLNFLAYDENTWLVYWCAINGMKLIRLPAQKFCTLRVSTQKTPSLRLHTFHRLCKRNRWQRLRGKVTRCVNYAY